MEQNQEQTQGQKQQSWLTKLAAESYQAELIVSGIAIVGVSMLPGLINKQIDWILLSIDSAYFIFYYFVFIYLSFGVGILYTCLIFHFLARTLWIGLVGLQSVFPQGINFDKLEHLSEDYREKIRKDLPEFQSFIEQLDRFCSIIFAFAFGTALVMISIAIVITLILGFTGILTYIFPELPIKTTAYILLSLLMIPLFLGSILNLKFLRERKWVQRFHYPMVKTTSKVLYNINYLPLTYIQSIFVSNYKFKKMGIVYAISIFFVSVFTIIFIVDRTNLLDLIDFPEELRGYRVDRVEPFEYEDQLKAGESILSPIIPSDQINTGFLRLFIPVTQRMEKPISALCDEWEPSSDELDRQAKRLERRTHRLNCLHQYFEVTIDDTPIENVSWSFFKHQNANEEGIITYLPTDEWEAGKHILSIIEKDKTKEGEPLMQRIWFWLEKR